VLQPVDQCMASAGELDRKQSGCLAWKADKSVRSPSAKVVFVVYDTMPHLECP
jgi:hypothetical protein